MLHPKGTRRIFDKEKSNIFSNDFANGKIDTIMGLATLSLRMQKGGLYIIKRRQRATALRYDLPLIKSALAKKKGLSH